MNDQEIILKRRELAEKHFEYTNELKKNFIVGQLSFLNAGKLLRTIRDEQTYLSEDPHLKMTFNKFIEETDIPIPGDTKKSRVRVAQMLMKVYEFFVESNVVDCSNNTLGEIGYSKLNLIIPPIQTDTTTADEWIAKAQKMSYRDLKEELKGMSLEDQFDCKHDDIERIVFWKCRKCGATFHDDPSLIVSHETTCIEKDDDAIAENEEASQQEVL
jgi:rubrerythrin